MARPFRLFAAAYHHTHLLPETITISFVEQWEDDQGMGDATRLGQLFFGTRMACMVCQSVEPGGHSFVMTDDDTTRSFLDEKENKSSTSSGSGPCMWTSLAERHTAR